MPNDNPTDVAVLTTFATPGGFPVLIRPSERQEFPHCPKSVPWKYVEKFQNRAQLNHQQTLERLAERGGLAPNQLLALLHDSPLLGTRYQTMTTKTAVNDLIWHLSTLS